jgi:hypothetical protein
MQNLKETLVKDYHEINGTKPLKTAEITVKPSKKLIKVKSGKETIFKTSYSDKTFDIAFTEAKRVMENFNKQVMAKKLSQKARKIKQKNKFFPIDNIGDIDKNTDRVLVLLKGKSLRYLRFFNREINLDEYINSLFKLKLIYDNSEINNDDYFFKIFSINDFTDYIIKATLKDLKL